MRILFAISSLGSGGAERVASTLANAWVERGHDVTLLATYSSRGGCFYPISEKVDLLYLADATQRVGKSPLAYWARFVELRRLIRERKPDVVLSFLANVNAAMALARLGLKVPLIVSERVNPFVDQAGWLLRVLRKATYPLADVVAFQTADVAHLVRTKNPGIRAIEVVPNPLPAALNEVKKEPASDGRLRLVAMGRLTPQKQFHLLVSAFSKLSSEHPAWDLWIWGDGPLRYTLQEQIAELGLANRAFLPGTTSDPWSELAKAEMFVLCSAFEGFPNALLEAMAIGLPCISFDCPSGPREITRNGEDALLLPLGDAQSLTRQIGRLMQCSDLRSQFGMKAAQSVRERYELRTVLSMWDHIFDNARKSL